MRDRMQSHCNQLLQQQLSIGATELHDAVRYSVLAGGKRIRPLLVYAAGQCVNADQHQLDRAAIAVEFIHAYSLIHDDLPAMDNADLRHGQLSCHRHFGQATAVLAGDALQSMAFEVLSLNNNNEQTKILAQAATAMVFGQHFDLLAENTTVDLLQLQNIHSHKTGALIVASIQLGLLCGARNESLFLSMTQFAEKLGLAFQIQDDILDATAKTTTLGKAAGIDNQQHKATYVTMLGLKVAQEKLQQIHQQLLIDLHNFPHTEFLTEITQFIMSRDH